MDLAQQLVRSCVRSFYETKHILVIDALVIHSALRDDDMAYLMGMNTKELHKLCGRLREDRFLAVHTRPEVKEGQQRPINRTYYYIDYRATIDAIKWRVYLIDKAVQGNTIPDDERKEYFCARCKSEYTVLDILDLATQQGFHCRKCNYILERDVNNNRGGHEQSSKLSKQFEFITGMLPKIDQVLVPENTFEQALASQRPVIRDATNPAYETAPVGASSEKPTAVRGMTNVGPTSIAVTVTNSDGPTEAELAAEKARKAQLAAQNALPFHFTHSTVNGEQVKFGTNSLPVSQLSSLEPDKKDIGTPSALEDGAEIDDYFARLKAEQAKEAEQEQDEEYETDEDEEDEGFEDVVPNGALSGIATPIGVLKKSGSISGSGTSTGVTSPVTGPGTPVEDVRPAKKVRIEEPSPAPAIKEENEESDEDMEFEDVQ